MSARAICSICLENFTPNCNIKSPKCGHVFHFECISQSFRTKPECPVCRQPGNGLFHVRLDFNSGAEIEEANVAKMGTSDSQKQLRILKKKLLEEEEKNKRANQRISELENQKTALATGCSYRSSNASSSVSTAPSTSSMMSCRNMNNNTQRSCSFRPRCSATHFSPPSSTMCTRMDRNCNNGSFGCGVAGDQYSYRSPCVRASIPSSLMTPCPRRRCHTESSFCGEVNFLDNDFDFGL